MLQYQCQPVVSTLICVFCWCRIVAAQLNDTDKYVCVAHNSLNKVLVGAELIVRGMYRGTM